MQLKRTNWQWLGLVLVAGFFWNGCKEKPEPQPVPAGTEQTPEESKEPGLRPPTNVTPVKPWPGKATIRIYYDREALAPEWIKSWTAAAPYHVEQIKLPGEGKPLPGDGDLYMVSPPMVQKLRTLVEWQSPQSLVPLDQIKPLFTGHSFDPDNLVSLPWRWSPYVFYRKRATSGQALPLFNFAGWAADEHSAWPEDWALLWAMKRHLAQGSANAPVNESEIKANKVLKEQLSGHVFPEEECWKQFSDGKIKNTFALAAWRLKGSPTDDASVEWAIPHQGTLLQFDQLMVPAKSAYASLTGELVKQLLSLEEQNKLQSLTGYFPVRVGSTPDLKNAALKMPDGPWMDNSEFLVLDLNALFSEPAPSPSPTVTPTTTTTPPPTTTPTASPTPGH